MCCNCQQHVLQLPIAAAVAAYAVGCRLLAAVFGIAALYFIWSAHNILTNIKDDSVLTTLVDHNGLGDGHAAVSLSLKDNSNIERWKENVVYIERRALTKINRHLFKENLMETNWKNMGINGFLKKFNGHFKSCFKLRKKKVRKSSHGALKWLSKGIKISSLMKRVLCSIDKSHNDPSLIHYKNQYIKIYRKVLVKARLIATQSEINNERYRSKGIWKVVNKLNSKKSGKTREQLMLKIDSKIIVDPSELSNIFSIQFNHGNLPSCGDHSVALNFLRNNTGRVADDMVIRKVTPLEVRKIVAKMENKTSTGYDDIPISIIKENIEILDAILANFFNSCLERVYFGAVQNCQNHPNIQKESKLDPKTIDRYLCCPHSQSARQFGYREGVGTLDAMDTLLDDVVRRLNDRNKVAGLFLDLSSAFDMVDHNILLQKLQHYGIRGTAFSLFQSYLKNRKQFVEVRQVGRDGFTNDLINYVNVRVPEARLILYADDTNAILSKSTMRDLETVTNATLTAFSEWFSKNDLKINLKKTCSILFKTTTKNKATLDLTLNNQKVEMLEVVKFLGINMDRLLNWKTELNSIESSISSACYALRTLRDILRIDQLKMVYFALVESKLRYSIKYWGNSYAYNISKAFTMQKRAIRIIARIPPWESCKEFFKKYEILTVPSLYVFVLLIDIFKHRHKYETEDEMKIRLNTRRLELNYVIKPTLNIAKHCPMYQAVKLFNSLPNELKGI
ncbi:reverse transcriptase (RNA-dependent DNA polymerase) domain-containing protein [Phthorimaea operculella]|nr:reverse transcriptase (RNA-dependent DNA polymerase) domain-containing protein [Phthorimaea operculella]